MIDVGCGTGRFNDMFERTGARVVGADIDVGMLAAAKQRIRSPLVVADAHRLPFANESFEVAPAGADPALSKREPEMGLQAHSGGAPKARDQDVGNGDQKAPRASRPRAGPPAWRHDVAPVPRPAGFRHGGVRLLHR